MWYFFSVLLRLYLSLTWFIFFTQRSPLSGDKILIIIMHGHVIARIRQILTKNYGHSDEIYEVPYVHKPRVFNCLRSYVLPLECSFVIIDTDIKGT